MESKRRKESVANGEKYLNWFSGSGDGGEKGMNLNGKCKRMERERERKGGDNNAKNKKEEVCEVGLGLVVIDHDACQEICEREERKHQTFIDGLCVRAVRFTAGDGQVRHIKHNCESKQEVTAHTNSPLIRLLTHSHPGLLSIYHHPFSFASQS